MRFFLFLPLFLLLNYSQAQQGTTLEEYRYLTKGYAYQKGMGLDAAKEGYTFQKLYTSSNKIEFVGMYLSGKSSPQAILCVFDKGVSENSFLCLPNNSSAKDIIELYEKDRSSKMTYDKRKALDKALTELLFHQMGSPADHEVAIAYSPRETLVPKGISSQPLVASASAPSYPVQSTKDPWEGLPITSTKSAIPKSYDAIPAADNSNNSVPAVLPRATKLRVNSSLDQRQISYQPDIITKTQKKGKIVIKICVNQSGQVISSKFTQRGSTSLDAYLTKLAKSNAEQLRFKESHLPEQCGTLTYIFNL